jgi:hypothetical protein
MMMPAVIAYYRMLLWLYPAHFRRDYGDEMTAVFIELLSADPAPHSVAALTCRAIGELFTVAIPGHLASERVIAACLSLVITSTVLGSLVKVMMYMRPHQ